MAVNRILTWDGCVNVRDLGGLKTRDGRTTRWGVVVRGDHPARLSTAGWSALYAFGIRTIISLRTHGMEEDVPDSARRPADLTTLCVEIEDATDSEFLQQWMENGLWSTPLYYRFALERWPERHAAAISAIARARPGGVMIHCGRGVDRTGIITLLVLALAGVRPEEIVADYVLSLDPEREVLLANEHTTTPEVITATLDWLDIDAYLCEGGLSQGDLAAVRARLLDPSSALG
jgi:protein-tyrosine phosphatase